MADKANHKGKLTIVMTDTPVPNNAVKTIGEGSLGVDQLQAAVKFAAEHYNVSDNVSDKVRLKDPDTDTSKIAVIMDEKGNQVGACDVSTNPDYIIKQSTTFTCVDVNEPANRASISRPKRKENQMLGRDT